MTTCNAAVNYLTVLRCVLTLSDALLGQVRAIADELLEVRSHRGTVYLLGNGGSWCNAQHFLLHLRDRGFRAVDLLGDSGWQTASANDYDYDSGPARVLKQFMTPEDALLVISGSGDSENVMNALTEAKIIGARCLGLLGMGGGKAEPLCHQSIVVPSDDYGIIEDCHAAVIHMLSRIV